MLKLKINKKDIEIVEQEEFVRGTVGANLELTALDEYWLSEEMFNEITPPELLEGEADIVSFKVAFVFKRCGEKAIEKALIDGYAESNINLKTLNLVDDEMETISIPHEMFAESGSFKIGFYTKFGYVKSEEDYINKNYNYLVTPTLWSEDIKVRYGTDTDGANGSAEPTYTPSELEEVKQELSGKQGKLTAGENITITDDNVISADGGKTDQTYSATSTNAQSGKAVAEALKTIECSTTQSCGRLSKGKNNFIWLYDLSTNQIFPNAFKTNCCEVPIFNKGDFLDLKKIIIPDVVSSYNSSLDVRCTYNDGSTKSLLLHDAKQSSFTFTDDITGIELFVCENEHIQLDISKCEVGEDYLILTNFSNVNSKFVDTMGMTYYVVRFYYGLLAYTTYCDAPDADVFNNYGKYNNYTEPYAQFTLNDCIIVPNKNLSIKYFSNEAYYYSQLYTDTKIDEVKEDMANSEEITNIKENLSTLTDNVSLLSNLVNAKSITTVGVAANCKYTFDWNAMYFMKSNTGKTDITLLDSDGNNIIGSLKCSYGLLILPKESYTRSEWTTKYDPSDPNYNDGKTYVDGNRKEEKLHGLFAGMTDKTALVTTDKIQMLQFDLEPDKTVSVTPVSESVIVYKIKF